MSPKAVVKGKVKHFPYTPSGRAAAAKAKEAAKKGKGKK